jgi:NUMOD3 motif
MGKIPSDARTKYSAQKSCAKRRNIEWQFTFDDWWRMWDESGHWHLRGRDSGKYCMARYGDAGPYAPNNVRIITVDENRSKQREGSGRGRWKHSDGTKARISAAGKGRKASPEARANMSAAHVGHTGYWKGRVGPWLGRKHSDATRARMRESHRARLALAVVNP